jgi:hypothetical protein
VGPAGDKLTVSRIARELGENAHASPIQAEGLAGVTSVAALVMAAEAALVMVAEAAAAAVGAACG